MALVLVEGKGLIVEKCEKTAENEYHSHELPKHSEMSFILLITTNPETLISVQRTHQSTTPCSTVYAFLFWGLYGGERSAAYSCRVTK
jgi:hypothetical protein